MNVISDLILATHYICQGIVYVVSPSIPEYNEICIVLVYHATQTDTSGASLPFLIYRLIYETAKLPYTLDRVNMK